MKLHNFTNANGSITLIIDVGNLGKNYETDPAIIGKINSFLNTHPDKSNIQDLMTRRIVNIILVGSYTYDQHPVSRYIGENKNESNLRKIEQILANCFPGSRGEVLIYITPKNSEIHIGSANPLTGYKWINKGPPKQPQDPNYRLDIPMLKDALDGVQKTRTFDRDFVQSLGLNRTTEKHYIQVGQNYFQTDSETQCFRNVDKVQSHTVCGFDDFIIFSLYCAIKYTNPDVFILTNDTKLLHANFVYDKKFKLIGTLTLINSGGAITLTPGKNKTDDFELILEQIHMSETFNSTFAENLKAQGNNSYIKSYTLKDPDNEKTERVIECLNKLSPPFFRLKEIYRYVNEYITSDLKYGIAETARNSIDNIFENAIDKMPFNYYHQQSSRLLDYIKNDILNDEEFLKIIEKRMLERAYFDILNIRKGELKPLIDDIIRDIDTHKAQLPEPIQDKKKQLYDMMFAKFKKHIGENESYKVNYFARRYGERQTERQTGEKRKQMDPPDNFQGTFDNSWKTQYLMQYLNRENLF